jgi:hypothetical protein
MKTQLTPSWFLTVQSQASSFGMPVLVYQPTGDTYGPSDVILAYPSHGYATAAAFVERMAKTVPLDAGDKEQVARFLARA